MTEIPADVMETADACLPMLRDGILKRDMAKIIARAILAERERCAKIAEGWEATMQDGEHLNIAFKSVAAAIRGQS